MLTTKFKNIRLERIGGKLPKEKQKQQKNARGFIQRHIKKHIEDGMEQKRAEAVAYSEAKKRLSVPKRKKR